MTKECPIGLNCEHFECNRNYCLSLASPWPLPYDPWAFTEPEWREIHGIVVYLPEYVDCSDYSDEWSIISTDRHNSWVSRVRDELWLGGWWESVDLPYQGHPDGGLLVVISFGLNNSVTFACPWSMVNGYQEYPYYWESFEPAIPIDGYQHIFGKAPTRTDHYFADAWADVPTAHIDDGWLLYSYHFDH